MKAGDVQKTLNEAAARSNRGTGAVIGVGVAWKCMKKNESTAELHIT